MLAACTKRAIRTRQIAPDFTRAANQRRNFAANHNRRRFKFQLRSESDSESKFLVGMTQNLAETTPPTYFCTELGLRFDAFPILMSFSPPTFYLALLVVYFMEDRLAGYIPTISETGTEEPNNTFMVIAFATIAASIFFVGFVFYWHLVTFYPTTATSRFLLAFTVLAGMSGFIALSNCPGNLYHRGHRFCAFIGIAGLILIQFMCWWIVHPFLSQKANLWRLALVLAQFVCLAIIGFPGLIVTTRFRATLSAIGEYTILVLLAGFYMSFAKDLADVGQLLVACDELDECAE
jgi:hypothetical protein